MFGLLPFASICFALIFLGLSLSSSLGFAAEIRAEDDLEDAVEALVEQLETQIEPYLEKEEILEDARLLVFNLKHQQSGKRWHFSQILEKQLVAELSSETNFVMLHPQKTRAFLLSYWREMEQGKDHPVALQITESLQTPFLILGTFDFQEKMIRIQLQLVSAKSEAIYAFLAIQFPREKTPQTWLEVLPIYQNKAHLEIARAFIAEDQWALAEKELKQVILNSSPESIEAEGLLIWLRAAQGQGIAEKFIPFKTRHPQHPLLFQIEEEYKKQTILKDLEQSIQNREWLAVSQLLKEPVLVAGDPNVIRHYQQLLEINVVQWNYEILQQKNWTLLEEQWPLLLQVVQSEKAASVTALQQQINKRFREELENLIARKDRLEAAQLLAHFGKMFLLKQQHEPLKAAIAKIPLPPEGMLTLPAITFEMGQIAGAKNEQPHHAVTLAAFHLDQHEVTNQEYKACLAVKACPAVVSQEDEKFNEDRQPVVGVTWHQAKQYCEWEQKRLPTEAEWERAVEAGYSSFQKESSLLPLEDYAWTEENSGGRTRTIKTRKPNRYGIFDLLGNALEWVNDDYAADYYAWSPEHNPQGPPSGEFKVARGGSWFHPRQETCPRCRFYWSPTLVFNFIGFRCAVSLE